MTSRPRTLIATAALALAACGGRAPTAPSHATAAGAPAPPGNRVIMISIDGLMPASYREPDALGLKVPTLRTMVAEGASASAVASVFPTVTYPAHTTLVTGVAPGVHGIGTNRPPDPLDKNFGGWRWYAEDIAATTLWQAVEAQGRHAAVVTWPVTVGADVTYRVPEIWRSGTVDDQKLLRALSTPGLLDAVAAEHPSLWQELTPPDVQDGAQLAITRYLATRTDAELILVHVWMTDDAQHAHGPGSPEARAAIEAIDAGLGELVAALATTDAWARTAVVVVSDHGFAPIDREIGLGPRLVERGLVELGPDGKPTRARVTLVANGGTANLYLDDPGARAEVARVLAEPDVAAVLARVLTRDELIAIGGDPRADFALVARPGLSFGERRTGPLVAPSTSRGTHGYPPTDPAMAASFLAFGPLVPHTDVGAIPMTAIAPTIAAWLGVALPQAGAPIEGLTR